MEAISKSELKIKPHFWSETIEAFNELIQKEWNGEEAIIYQKDIVNLIISKRAEKSGLDSDFDYNKCQDLIFSNKQLDIEKLYSEKGFKVEYDQPGYCESYEATFKFK